MSAARSVYDRATVNCKTPRTRWTFLMIAAAALFVWQVRAAATLDLGARDPGVRAGAPAAGDPIAGVSDAELEYFLIGKDDFAESDGVSDGLGPRMNLDSCGGCHSQPSMGGSSPAVNPQVAFATKYGGKDAVPPFVTENGPVREARFVMNADGTRDGVRSRTARFFDRSGQ